MAKLGNLFKDESGAAAVEDGLLLALIAMVILTTVTTLGKTLSALSQMVATSVEAA